MKNIYILGANSRLATHINKKFLKEFKIIRIVRVAKKNEFTFRNIPSFKYQPHIVIDCIRISNYANIPDIMKTLRMQKKFVDKHFNTIEKYIYFSSEELVRKKFKRFNRNNLTSNYVYYKYCMEVFLQKKFNLKKLNIIRMQKIFFDNDTSFLEAYLSILKKTNIILVNNNLHGIYYQSILENLKKLLTTKTKYKLISYWNDNLSFLSRFDMLNYCNKKYFSNKFIIIKLPIIFNNFFKKYFYRYWETCIRSSTIDKQGNQKNIIDCKLQINKIVKKI